MDKRRRQGGVLGLLVCVFLIVLFCIMLSSAVDDSITASISNPKVLIYKNITSGKNLKFKSSVIVNNENDGDVKITFNPLGIWKKHISLKEKEIVLKPDERKEAFYTIIIDEPGRYDGEILITFKKKGYPNELSAVQELMVIATENKKRDLVLPVSGLVLTTVLVICLIILKRREKK